MDERILAEDGIPALVDWVGRWNLASVTAALGALMLALLDVVTLAQ